MWRSVLLHSVLIACAVMLAAHLSRNSATRFQLLPLQKLDSRARALASSATQTPKAAMEADPRAAKVLSYWFGEDWASTRKYATRQEDMKKWFFGGAAVDEEIKSQFSDLHATIMAGEVDSWLEQPANAIAAVIVMDQFSRNMFRGSPKAFASDDKALQWAKQIQATGVCKDCPAVWQPFLILPYEHSEKLEDQKESVVLFRKLLEQTQAAEAAGDPDAPAAVKMFASGLDYAIAHEQVVEQWGRFPHRNAVLGRESTPEEVAGMADGSIRKFG